MAVTLSDIAKDAGSSISTVSATLRGSYSTVRVSEKKRKHILRVARCLGYRPSHAARTLKIGKTNVLGMVIGEIHTPYYGEMTSLFMEEAAKHGYSIQIYVTNWEDERAGEAIDLLLGGRCDGILLFEAIMPSGHGQYEYIIKNKVPTVVLGSPAPMLAYIGEYWNSGFIETAEYLLSKGIRNTVFIGDNVTNLERLKLKSLKKVFAEYALNMDFVECHNKSEQAYDFGRSFRKLKNPPQVVLTENDTLATALLKGLFDSGVKVPEEVGVIGCNDTKFSEYSIPALTTIGFDKKVYVKKVIEMVMEMIEQKKLIFEQFFFPTYLVKRDSV
jgi:DNA-binding LacI/PurR family transcriptional regulator